MTTATQPPAQSPGHAPEEDPSSCPVFRMLPQALQAESRDHQHLWDYIHTLPLETLGVPEYHTELSRSMSDMKKPNIIYPVGGQIYIHIRPNNLDARHYYIAIEPGMNEDISQIMKQAELRLVDYVSDLDMVEDAEGRAGVLLGSLDRFCVLAKDKGRKSGAGTAKFNGRGGNKLALSLPHMEALRYRIVRDKARMGPLEPLLLDTNIEDISCSGLGKVFI